MKTILNMYLTLASVIIAGVSNMIFTKTKTYKNKAKPIDRGRCLRDGKRIFGDNKTVIGFISMIMFNIVAQVICGVIYKTLGIDYSLELYQEFYNIWINNIIIGFMLGFAYMICELPNSFIKRRIDIKPGKTDNGIKGFIFLIIDQIDSLIGVVLVLNIISDISIVKSIMYVILGAFTHISINYILYKLKIRRNI